MKMLVLFLMLSFPLLSQTFNEELEIAYKNAVKGVYFAFENIPDNKSRSDNKLIDNNHLLADVKLSKEVEGVVIESTGYYKTYTVTIRAYKSYSTLKDEGFLKSYN